MLNLMTESTYYLIPFFLPEYIWWIDPTFAKQNTVVPLKFWKLNKKLLQKFLEIYGNFPTFFQNWKFQSHRML